MNESWLAQHIREDREERQAALNLDRSQQRSSEEDEDEVHGGSIAKAGGAGNPAAASSSSAAAAAAIDARAQAQDDAETLSDSYESQPRQWGKQEEHCESGSVQTSQQQQQQQQIGSASDSNLASSNLLDTQDNEDILAAAIREDAANGLEWKRALS